MDTTRSTYRTPRGNPVELFTRPDTNDAAMVNALLGTDEYRIKDLRIEGWALDIGSHVGTIAIALAVDNPYLSVIAIEPVPDNAELIRRNVAVNYLGTRVFVEEAGAGALGQSTTPCMYGFTKAEGPGSEPASLHDTRFVGNVFRGDSNPVGTLIDAPVVTLAGLARKYDVTFRFCKIDCEGCEVHAFADGAELVQEIIGEFHDNLLPRLQELLDPTHHLEVLDDKGGIGMFRAVRR
jgi:FkbM family methyltransferase